MPELKFTEHALFRYCQRVLGADIAWLKDALMAELPSDSDGHHKLKNHDAYAVIEEGFVVTVMTEQQVKKLRKRPRKFRYREAREDY